MKIIIAKRLCFENMRKFRFVIKYMTEGNGR
jgi:hypothetical protein